MYIAYNLKQKVYVHPLHGVCNNVTVTLYDVIIFYDDKFYNPI